MRTIQVQGGMLRAEQVAGILEDRQIQLADLMLELLPTAAGYATPPVSGFSVGAVAAGMPDGEGPPALYLGANLEFGKQPLGETIHAEQAAVFNAWVAGEPGVSAIAVTAAPCGYCRQFLWELSTAEDLVVWSPAEPGAPPRRSRLADLLPAAFGPADLGVEDRLMSPADHPLRLESPSKDDLVQAALAAARRSYAPYSGTYAGCAVQTESNRIVAAPYAENAAFNPSVSPLAGALAVLNMGRNSERIAAVALVEAPGKISHREVTGRLLAEVAPDIELGYHEAGA